MGKGKYLGLGVVILVAVFLVVGVSGTAFATQPANVGDPVTNGVPAVQEVQSLTVTADGGTYTLDYGSYATAPTGAIAWDATAAAVQTAINAVLAGGRTVAVTGGPGDATGSTPYTLTFSATSGNVGGATSDTTNLTLTAGTATAVVQQIVDGALATGQNDISPHGGYSDQTDYCLQCHKQHGAYPNTTYNTGAFALMRNYSVTETCSTCHSIYNSGGTSAFDPGIAGLQIGTTAQRSVYENGQPANHASMDAGSNCPAGYGACAYNSGTNPANTGPNGGEPHAETPGVYGHKIGYGFSGTPNNGTSTVNPNNTSRYASNWQYSWNYIAQTALPPNSTLRSGAGTASRVAGGFYCDSCHTPHGADFGYAVNTEKGHTNTGTVLDGNGNITSTSWNDGNQIAWHNTTGATAAGVANGAWGNVYLQRVGAAFASTGWNVCQSPNTNCVPATTANAQGQQVSLFAYQLLTMANHQYRGSGPVTNPNLCSNGFPGTVSPATNADCLAVYGAGVTAGYTNTIPAPTSYGITAYGHDKAQWCGTCHSYAVDTSLGGTVHAHPTGCDACHGNTPQSISNPGGANGYPDFPHTSKEEAMLQELPDALCITCHTNLP